MALAAALLFLHSTIGPRGGAWLFPGQRTSDPIADLLLGRYLCSQLPLIFAAMVADEAFEDGAPPLRAYGIALVVGGVVAPFLNWYGARLFGWDHVPQARMASWFSFALSANFGQGGPAMAMYGYWRVTRRSLREVQKAHAERIRNEQHLLSAKLLALQARVEPQLLFDTLSRVWRLHESDPQAADALLADLIALLRALLPGGTAVVSNVGREFELVAAWMRVARDLGEPADVTVEAPDRTKADRVVAPMIVLPALRAALASPAGARLAWRLRAEATADGRLRITLDARDGSEGSEGSEGEACALPSDALESVRERLARLYGQDAVLTCVDAPPELTLDLPRLPQ